MNMNYCGIRTLNWKCHVIGLETELILSKIFAFHLLMNNISQVSKLIAKNSL